jgi:hypothetical protein
LRLIAVKFTAIAAALVVLTTGCGVASGAHPARPASVRDRAMVTADFSAMGLAFRYPQTWRVGTWSADVSSFSALIAYLSTSRLQNPCQQTVRPGVMTSSCGFPVSKLLPGGVLIRWSANGNPGWRLPATNTIVGGRRAFETVTSGGWCATLGGTETITVAIPRNIAMNWFEMDACLAGPGLTRQEAEISSMLRSVRIAKDY